MRNLIPSKIRGWRSKQINALIDCVSALYPLPTPTIRREFSTGGVRLNTIAKDSGVVSPVQKSFSVTINGYTASVLAGTIRVAWANYAIAATTTLALSGSTAWIYAYAVKSDLSSNGFAMSNSEPISTGSQWQWPLVKATSIDGGATYTIADGDVRHDGDFYFYSPINKP